jgi:hypothetical protein
MDELEIIPAEQETSEVSEVVLPSQTYQVTDGRILGKIDYEAAMLQAIQKILSTARTAWAIYSDQYGHEMDDLIGKDWDYVYADITRVLTEALMSDDRVNSVDIKSMEQTDSTSLHVTLTVNTLWGEINTETEVAGQ